MAKSNSILAGELVYEILSSTDSLKDLDILVSNTTVTDLWYQLNPKLHSFLYVEQNKDKDLKKIILPLLEVLNLIRWNGVIASSKKSLAKHVPKVREFLEERYNYRIKRSVFGEWTFDK